MTTQISPFNILSGTESLGNRLEGWKLDDIEGISADRHFRKSVRFARPFAQPPVVHIGITGFDVSNEDASRLTASVAHITTSGFDIVLSTWLNTRLWRVDVSWLAIGA